MLHMYKLPMLLSILFLVFIGGFFFVTSLLLNAEAASSESDCLRIENYLRNAGSTEEQITKQLIMMGCSG